MREREVGKDLVTRFYGALVLLAAFSLLLGILDGFEADQGLFDLWIDSWVFKIAGLGVGMLVAPLITKHVKVR